MTLPCNTIFDNAYPSTLSLAVVMTVVFRALKVKSTISDGTCILPESSSVSTPSSRAVRWMYRETASTPSGAFFRMLISREIRMFEKLALEGSSCVLRGEGGARVWGLLETESGKVEKRLRLGGLRRRPRSVNNK